MATTTAAASSAASAASSAASAAAAATPPSRSFEVALRMKQSLVLLVFLIGTVIVVAWLILHPRPPMFRLDSFSLSGLPNVSDASSPSPKLHVLINLTATNPNKKLSVVIQDVDHLALCHRKRWLAFSSDNDKSWPENNISRRGRGILKVHGTRKKRPFQFIVSEDLMKGSAVMSVRMKVSVKFMSAYFPSKRASVKVECENFSVELSSSKHIGKLKDGGKDCSVRFV